ncbi:MAG: LPS export ABC transporter permease LptG [Oricola sp.]
MGRTLQAYFFVHSLRMIFFFALGIAAIAYLVDFTELSNRTGDLPMYSVSIALSLSAMRVPYILQVALPFIVMFATMTTLMLLNRKYELVVARSAGVSAWQFLAPVLAAAFAVGVLAIAVMNPLASYGFSRAEAIEGEWRSRPSKSLFAQDRPWLRQAQQDGGSMLIGAARAAGESTTLYDAIFLDIHPDGAVRRRMDAATARLADGEWVLSDVTISRASEAAAKQTEMTIPTALNPAVIKEALIPPEMIAFFALGRQIDTVRAFGISANPFRMQYHSLMAMPLMLVAMTLIAATVSLRFVRFGQSGGMILAGIGAGFMLYVVTAIAKSFGSAGVIPPILAAWLPVAVATLFGVAYLLHREDG